jgi:hypothetical protein
MRVRVRFDLVSGNSDRGCRYQNPNAMIRLGPLHDPFHNSRLGFMGLEVVVILPLIHHRPHTV